TAEYDQSVAGKAIATFTDFITLFPEDPRVPEAQKKISAMKSEQARGSYTIAHYYEKKKRWDGALIYYNEVLLRDPNSKYAQEAKKRIDEIKKQTAQASRTPLNAGSPANTNAPAAPFEPSVPSSAK